MWILSVFLVGTALAVPLSTEEPGQNFTTIYPPTPPSVLTTSSQQAHVLGLTVLSVGLLFFGIFFVIYASSRFFKTKPPAYKAVDGLSISADA